MPRNNFYGEDTRDRKKYYEEECPECEERRYNKDNRGGDNGYMERPKKRRIEDDRGESHEKHCPPPCPDWYTCPPPWFWWKPEHDEDKECNKKDDNKADCKKDECKKEEKRKECCGELEAYGYVYSLTATAVTILTNNDVVFTNNGPLDDVTHTPNTSQVFIRKSGVYQVYYGINSTLGIGATISLAVNGAVDPSTTIPLAVAASETSGKVLLNLRAGDFLTLRNSSAVSITLAVAPAVGAQLTLERIDELDKCIY